jgi:HIV Tat-specific factor 1
MHPGASFSYYTVTARDDLYKPQKMQGRFFAGRKIEASLWIGKQHFKRSGAAEDVEETGGYEGEKKRLDAFAQWLLTEGD